MLRNLLYRDATNCWVDIFTSSPKCFCSAASSRAAAALLDATLQKHFNELTKMSAQELVASRYNKFRKMAQFLRVE